MSQRITTEELRTLPKERLLEISNEVAELKAKFEAIKATKPLNAAQLAKYNELTEYKAEVDAIMAEKDAVQQAAAQQTETEQAEVYKPKPGTENMIHLSVVRGRKFNPLTGKEESAEYVQMFTYSEWKLFKEHHKGLGYTILKVLHDPYNEATPDVELKK